MADTLARISFSVDADDERSINEAVAHYQRTMRWERFDQKETPGVFLPEGESDLRGAILGEICRDWLEVHSG